MHKDTGHQFHQRMLLKREFTDIVAENKRRLVCFILHIDYYLVEFFILEYLSTVIE